MIPLNTNTLSFGADLHRMFAWQSPLAAMQGFFQAIWAKPQVFVKDTFLWYNIWI